MCIFMQVAVVKSESEDGGYEDIHCQEKDHDCLQLLCPQVLLHANFALQSLSPSHQGWSWSREEGRCFQNEGWLFPRFTLFMVALID
jgi:hypothetical protein